MNHSALKYSFIIPTYNNKVLLKNTLEALNYQAGYGHYEVILVDDGSIDNTYSYIKGVNRNYSLKYLFLERSEDSCRARTRNYGWRNAHGKIIVFIDSDIIVRPDYLEELERCFSVSNEIAVIGNRLLLNKENTFYDITSCDIFRNNRFDYNRLDILEFRHFLYEITSYNINALQYPWMQLYSCNVAVPKKFLEKTGGFDESFKGWGLEDVELGYALFEKNVDIIINSRLEVIHQYHGVRNDFVINKENIPSYDRNIDLFLAKHPDAFMMDRESAFSFMKGEITNDSAFLDANARYIGVDFMERKQLDSVKKLILRTMSRKDTILVINDYVEDTDLDIWIQLPGENGRINARYYPVSKRIDNKIAQRLLKSKKLENSGVA